MVVVGITEIAKLANVSRQVVRNWFTRESSFPKPFAKLACGQIWNLQDVTDWLAAKGKLHGASPPRMPFRQRATYAHSDLAEFFKGDMQSYLPQRGGRVVCGCLNPEMNPKAPYEVWVGNGPRIKRKAELLIAQKEPIPVFMKRHTNQWLYVGMMEAVAFSMQRTLVSQITKTAKRPVIGVLKLRPVDDTRSSSEQVRVIDYLAESERYRPSVIKTLLIGEAPPPSGTSYFYVPSKMALTIPIEKDRTLPATIFNHYFGVRPQSDEEYVAFLRTLRDNGVFLVDICDEPVQVRQSPEGIERIRSEIPKLASKLAERGITVAEDQMVFLLARKDYQADIRRAFPSAKRFRWKDFRMNHEEPLLPNPRRPSNG